MKSVLVKDVFCVLYGSETCFGVLYWNTKTKACTRCPLYYKGLSPFSLRERASHMSFSSPRHSIDSVFFFCASSKKDSFRSLFWLCVSGRKTTNWWTKEKGKAFLFWKTSCQWNIWHPYISCGGLWTKKPSAIIGVLYFTMTECPFGVLFAFIRIEKRRSFLITIPMWWLLGGLQMNSKDSTWIILLHWKHLWNAEGWNSSKEQ